MAAVTLLESVERAAHDLRRGLAVIVDGDDGSVIAAAAEGADALRIARVGDLAAASPNILLTHARATTLKMRLYTPEIVAIEPPPDDRARWLAALIDPTSDMAHPLGGPYQAKRTTLPSAYAASVKLAKLAGLLPATIAAPLDAARANLVAREERLERVAAVDIRAYDETHARNLRVVTQARVPLAGAENTEVIAFRASDGGPEHLAIVVGAPEPPGPVLVRLHSECFTGDLLGSLKCDCGDQLRGAIRTMGDAGAGIVLYLAQEGRGIGLMNKLRAYRLQDQGFDTMEANLRLGFDEDERFFLPAAVMLKTLGFGTIRLLTNNPDKVAALRAHGLDVVERVAHSFPSNPHNADYLATKRDKGGHTL